MLLVNREAKKVYVWFMCTKGNNKEGKMKVG
jgi:hypothetical protein